MQLVKFTRNRPQNLIFTDGLFSRRLSKTAVKSFDHEIKNAKQWCQLRRVILFAEKTFTRVIILKKNIKITNKSGLFIKIL